MAYSRPNRTFAVETLKHVGASSGANGPDLEGGFGNGCLVFINITALSGTSPTLTVTIQGKDRVSGQYYNILSSVALASTGFTVLRVKPGLTASANVTANDMIPPDFRIITAIGGTTPAVSATIAVSVIH